MAMLDPFAAFKPVIFQNRVLSNGVGLSNNISANVLVNPLVVPIGDWLISGSVGVTFNAATTTTQIEVSVSKVSATIAASSDFYNSPFSGEFIFTFDTASESLVGQKTIGVPVPAYRFQADTQTTLYLVVSCSFATNTASAFGSLQATPMFP